MNVRIVFMGTPDFGVPVLESLVQSHHDVVAVYTRPDRPSGRGRRLAPSPVKQAAVSHGIAVIEPETLRGESRVTELASLSPDLVVVAAFAYLLPEQLLRVPRLGCLNVHPSLLPRHRGPSPVASAILNGDDRTGVSIMLMDAGLDTGPVLSQEAAAISDSDTTGSLTAALAGLGAGLLVATIDGWLAGAVVPRVQNEREATYSGKVGVEDGLLDWTQPATVLSRGVRAYNPWPGCHTFWEGQRLKIHSAVPLVLRPHGEPGRVVQLPGPVPTRIGVVTAQGVLGLGGIQLEGKREVSAEEFVRGHREFVGAMLGR
ncbi:MAG: methionyl-tRNA formyltransferase [Dehalococcoidia bacterium]|nr:methionyl-tRNA formyltransferase [Dehalococcoidia bacterium]